MTCDCCGLALPDSATVAICRPCFHALRTAYPTPYLKCTLHNGKRVPHDS